MPTTPEHVDMIALLRNLGINLGRIGRDREAEPLLEAAFPVLLESLGQDHARTRRAAGALVDMYEATGRAAMADPYPEYAG